MFASPPTLRIRSPSSTTVEFTLSNAPPPTLTRKLLTLLTALLRIILFTVVLLLLITKYHPPPYPPAIHPQFHPVLTTLAAFSGVLKWKYMLAVSAAVLYMVAFTGGYTEESLVVIRGLGVQISTTTGLWGRRSRFIPTERVGGLWIHEGFRGFEVKFYLAVVVEGEEGLVVVFPTLLPGRRVLELVWRGAKRCLYEPQQVAVAGVD